MTYFVEYSGSQLDAAIDVLLSDAETDAVFDDAALSEYKDMVN